MRTMNRFSAALVVLLLAACASAPQQGVREVTGEIESINLNERTLVLRNVENAPANASTVTVTFAEDTTVRYGGQTFRPQNLERGDQVTVLADVSGERLAARSITVVRNVRATAGLAPGSNATTDRYANASRGSIRSIDTTTRTIEIDLGGLTAHIVRFGYDDNTTFEENGQRRSVADLRVGDTVDVNTARVGDRIMAQSINVIRAPDPTEGRRRSSTAIADVSGMVVAVSRSAIHLERATWGRTFTGEMPANVSIRFDDRTQLEYQGRRGSPLHLERGDIIDIQLRGATTPYVAEQIWVLRDVRERF